MEDELILELFRNRDEQAVSQLSKKYGSACLHAARSILAQYEEAEECVNSAYYEAWQNMPPDSPKNLRAYICRIVKNKALDKVRYDSAEKRNAQFTMSLEELHDCIPDRYDPEYDLSAKELAGAINRFLRKQGTKQRKVFVRRYWYGDSVSEIAQAYGMNAKTVATYLFRTREKLKVYLEKEGYNYE